MNKLCKCGHEYKDHSKKGGTQTMCNFGSCICFDFVNAQPKPVGITDGIKAGLNHQSSHSSSMISNGNCPTPRQDEPSEDFNKTDWLLDFAFVMESLGAKRPTEESEKWEQLMVLIEAKVRNRCASERQKERKKVIREVEEVEQKIRGLFGIILDNPPLPFSEMYLKKSDVLKIVARLKETKE